MDERAEWCNNFAPVPTSNGKVRLVDLVRQNQTLILSVLRGPKLNDIFQKINNIKYFSLIDASSSCHNLKLDERSSYLTTFTCQFGRYRYKRLPIGADPLKKCSKEK